MLINGKAQKRARKALRVWLVTPKGRFFVDRDGFLFRYILDYMRDQQLVLPDHFPERGRLQREAEYFNLPELVKLLAPKISKQNSLGDDGCQSDPEESSPSADASRNLASLGTATCSSLAASDGKRTGFITIGYRGSYTLGRDSQTDAKFRRVARIMVCGKTSLAKEVFGETLNESRDPDRPPERYTCRYYLKFTFLEQAFDKLADAGFHMVACNSTGTCAFTHDQTDDKIWTSYTEYVFYRPPSGFAQQLLPQISRNHWKTLLKGKVVLVHSTIVKLHNGSKSSSPALIHDPGFVQLEEGPVQDLCIDRNSADLDLQDLPPPDPVPLLDPQDILDLPLPPPPTPVLEHSTSPSDCSASSPPLSAISPVRPTTLTLKTSPCTTGNTKSGGLPAQEPEDKEKKIMEEELKKCIEDFRKIRIPKLFPDQKQPNSNGFSSGYGYTNGAFGVCCQGDEITDFSYISKCIDDVTISKSITTRSNQKLWMTAKVRSLLKYRDFAFRAGDKDALRTARAKLSRAIREAKRAHTQRIHGHFQSSGDTWCMWQGIQSITNYRPASPACDSDASFPDALNSFYTRFEARNDVTAKKTFPPLEDQVLCLTTADVRKTLCRGNPWKAAGPDSIPGRVLRECAEQLH
ncbi:hypothetical protein QTP70_002001 [Hemibagrus guttatus]|uniref:Potassium channel tetramerisation-type BTB domain-containing protein n=1 Tax=Hemibagrus guttatus TaxID=175788 RepID=A0AAE0V4Q5_9TELE|nr:hypothetical protein QTP70_002001 [Hemibagrus guttatus]